MTVDRLERLLLAAWVTVCALWRANGDDQSDALWMAREGQAVLNGGGWVHPDRWSWAPVPNDFVPTSPGWQVLLALASDLGGRRGIYLLSLLMLGLALTTLAWAARLSGASALATSASLVIGSTLDLAFFRSRSGLPALALLVLHLVLLWRFRAWLARVATSRAIFMTLALGSATASLGIWLHASWAGLALLDLACVAVLLRHPDGGSTRRRRQAWTASACGVGIGTLTGPLGPAVWAEAARVSAACQGIVKEWKPPWAIGTTWTAIWCLALGAIAASAWMARSEGRLRAGLPGALLLAAATATLAAPAGVRFLLLGLALLIPLNALLLDRIADATSSARSRLGQRGSGSYWLPIAFALALLALSQSAVTAVTKTFPIDTAITALPAGCRLFSDDIAAKSTLALRPDVPVWIDGRQDYYGRDRLLQARRFLDGKEDRVVPAGTTCVLLRNGAHPGIEAALRASEGWRERMRGNEFTLWLPRA